MPHPTRIFHTEADLEKAWNEYKAHLETEAEKWPKVQYVGRDGKRVTDYPKLPLTFEGFETWAYEHYGCIEQYFLNKDGYYEDFVGICSRIKKEIRADQITGGLLGNYNPSITQRLNGLVDKSNVSISTEQPLFPDTPQDEIPSDDGDQ